MLFRRTSADDDGGSERRAAAADALHLLRRKGATIQHPGCGGADIGFVPFSTIIEPIGRELRIPNRVLDALVSKCTEAGRHATSGLSVIWKIYTRCLLEWCWGRCRRGRPRGCYSFLEFLNSSAIAVSACTSFSSEPLKYAGFHPSAQTE